MFGISRKKASSSPVPQGGDIDPKVGDCLADRMGRKWQVKGITMFGVEVCDVAGSLLGATFLLSRGELHKLCRAEPALGVALDRW